MRLVNDNIFPLFDKNLLKYLFAQPRQQSATQFLTGKLFFVDQADINTTSSKRHRSSRPSRPRTYNNNRIMPLSQSKPFCLLQILAKFSYSPSHQKQLDSHYSCLSHFQL
jgi:hypothetical protein